MKTTAEERELKKEHQSYIANLYAQVSSSRIMDEDMSDAERFRVIASTSHLVDIPEVANVCAARIAPQFENEQMLNGTSLHAYSFNDGTASIIVMNGSRFDVHTFDSIHDIGSGYSKEMPKRNKPGM